MWQQLNLGLLISFFFGKAEWNCGLDSIYSEKPTDVKLKYTVLFCSGYSKMDLISIDNKKGPKKRWHDQYRQSHGDKLTC